MKPTEDFAIQICDFLHLDSDIFSKFLFDLRQKEWNRWGGGTVETTVAEIVYILVRMLGSKNLFEMGTNMGYATCHIAQALVDSDSISPFISVELDKNNYMMGSSYIGNKKLLNRVNLILGDSVTTAKKQKDKFDFIFVDSSHEYNHTKKEISIINDILTENGIILFHDAVNESLGVKRAVEEIDETEWQKLILDTQPNTGLAIVKRRH